jgi:ABC-type transporter Mla subunit MlaD
VTNPSDHEARISALESRVEQVAADAAAARHLAAAGDRDLADLTVKVDANRAAINALGVQTAGQFERVWQEFDRVDARFDQVDARFDQVDARFDRLENEMRTAFAEMRAKFDRTAAGLERIAGLITGLGDR